MSATAEVATPAVAPAEPRAARGMGVEPVIARRAFRQVWIGAVVCALVFGGTAASSALSYVTTFPTLASRQEIAASTSNDAGLSVLLGPISGIDTVGGYTVYKGFVFLTTIGAIWAALAANRLLRGAEDSGQWQLVLAGSTRAARATAATLVALAAAIGVIFGGTTLIMLATAQAPDVGFAPGATVLYGLSIAVPPAVFAGVGALTSQLRPNRRAANSLALTVVGVCFVLRMVADASPASSWVRWLTPFGWTELMQPFTENNPWPLVPAVIATAVLAGTSIVLAGRRDTGDAVLASSDVSEPRAFGLGSAFGLTARLELPSLVVWCVGAAAAGLMLGIIAKMTTASVPASFRDTLDKFGVEGTFARQYFGVAFLLVGTVVALLPAGQIGAACDEQTSGRLARVLVGPATRASWFVGRLALAAGAIVLAGLLAGLGAWASAVTQGVDVDLVTMAVAGLNVVPTALVVLGGGALVLAIAPRAAAACVYGIVIWSLLIDLLASMVSGVSWLEHLSLFHYMALAPAVDPDPLNLAVTTGIALALAGAGTAVFVRRDLPS